MENGHTAKNETTRSLEETERILSIKKHPGNLIYVYFENGQGLWPLDKKVSILFHYLWLDKCMQYGWLLNKNSTSLWCIKAIYSVSDLYMWRWQHFRENLSACQPVAVLVPKLIWLFPAKVCNWYCASTGQLISETTVELNIYRDTERVWKPYSATRWHEDVFSVAIYICRSCDRSLVSFTVQYRSCVVFFAKQTMGPH